ncbi:Initiation factor eIF-4 gamma MA3 [Gracilaria domingensis]|nr:Initiation factor eIF-4 gamma MA3 [Gracilaria domingensis]
MAARRSKRRTRDTHDPQTSLPSKLLDEISGGPENKRPSRVTAEKHVSRREERKRKRQEKKEASTQARTKWKERRNATTRKQQRRSSEQSSRSGSERKRSLSTVNDSSPAKKHRPESADSHGTHSDGSSVHRTAGKNTKRLQKDTSTGEEGVSFSPNPDSVPNRTERSHPNPSTHVDGVQEVKSVAVAVDDSDAREIHRLEKLLGIDRLRKRKNARGDDFEYGGVFDEGEDDLVDLIKVCDRTLDRHSEHSGNGAQREEIQELGNDDSDEAPSEVDDVLSRKIRRTASTKPGASFASEAVGNDGAESFSESESEENQSSYSSSETIQNTKPNGDTRSKYHHRSGSDHESQHGSQHGANSEHGGDINTKSSISRVHQDSREGKQATKLLKYVPPSARKRTGVSSEGVKRRVRGLLNRVADANASGVAHDIAQIFKSKDHNISRQELADLYANAALDSVRDGSGVGYVNPYLQSHAAIASHLGKQVDGVILATFLVSAIRRIIAALEESRDETEVRLLVEQDGSGTEVFGYVAVVCSLYERKAVSSRVVYDLVRVIGDPLTQTRVELLLVLLRRIGALLRKDDPSSLKDMIEFIQSKASENEAGVSSNKFQVMLDLISDMKNEKLKKSASKDQDAKFAWATAPDTPFSASIAELLDDEFTSLRWWNQSHDLSVAERNGILSAADLEVEEQQLTVGDEDENRDLATLAHSLRLNTEYRKALFGAIMSSLNVSDSYDKLERMGAFETKKNHDRDTALVILHCCGAEKIFNPFYAYLAEKMCQRSRRCRFTFEFAFCDIFRMLPGAENGAPMSKRKSRNYYQMLAHLWASKALSLCILRRFPDLHDCGEHEKVFVRGALDTLFTKHGKSSDVLVPFTKLSSESWSGAKAFRLSLAVFFRHHLLQSVAKDGKELASQALVSLESE